MNAPEISTAIWSELDIKVSLLKLAKSVSLLVILVLKLELATVKAPVISVAIWAELEINVLATIVSFAVILVLNEALGALNAPEISTAIWSELDIRDLAVINSFAVTLVLNEALDSVNAPDITVEVKFLIVEALGPNEPEISSAIWAELESKLWDVINWILSISCSISWISLFILAIVVLKLALVSVNEPEISPAIWAELDKSVLATIVSFAVTLVLKLELAAVNEPEMSFAIWAELDNKVFDITISFADTLVLKEELTILKDPLIPAAVKLSIKASLDRDPVSTITLKVVSSPLSNVIWFKFTDALTTASKALAEATMGTVKLLPFACVNFITLLFSFLSAEAEITEVGPVSPKALTLTLSTNLTFCAIINLLL